VLELDTASLSASAINYSVLPSGRPESIGGEASSEDEDWRSFP